MVLHILMQLVHVMLVTSVSSHRHTQTHLVWNETLHCLPLRRLSLGVEHIAARMLLVGSSLL